MSNGRSRPYDEGGAVSPKYFFSGPSPGSATDVNLKVSTFLRVKLCCVGCPTMSICKSALKPKGKSYSDNTCKIL